MTATLQRPARRNGRKNGQVSYEVVEELDASQSVVDPHSDSASVTLTSLIHKHAKRRSNHGLIARKIIEELQTFDDLSVLESVITDEVRRVLRAPVRRSEQRLRAFVPGQDRVASDDMAQFTREQFREFAKEYVKVPGEARKLRAGIVTVPQWEARATMFEAQEMELARSREKCLLIIGTLDRFKVATIDDLIAQGES